MTMMRQAEYKRGGQMRQAFISTAQAEDEGVTFVGSPTVNHGLTCAAGKYATMSAAALRADEISIDVWFTPYESPTARRLYFYDSTTAGRTRCVKYDTGQWDVTHKGVTVARAYIGSYSAYWKIDELNLLTVKLQAANSRMYFNGHEISTFHPVAGTVTATGLFYAGATNAGADYFDGIIHDIRITHGLLTEQEHIDNYNGETWRWHDSAVVDLPMDSDHVTGTTVEDLTGDYDGTMAGTAALVGNHINFPGTGNVNLDSAAIGAAEKTIYLEFAPDFNAGDGAYYYLLDSSVPGRTYVAKSSTNELLVASQGSTPITIALATYGPHWITTGRNLLALRLKTGDSEIYLNNHLIATSALAMTVTPTGSVFLGCSYGGTTCFEGNMTRFMVYPGLHTESQRLDVDTYLLGKSRLDR